MARAYSQDLRDRVIGAGTSARAAAARFGIGVSIAQADIEEATLLLEAFVERAHQTRPRGQAARRLDDPEGV